MKRLDVTADDFGLSPEINEAVEMAWRDGILTSASLMVGGPACADAVRRAKEMPGLRVGLHLVLADGPPVLPRNMLPALTREDGWLRDDLARLGMRLMVDPQARRQMRDEIRTQFEAFTSTGLTLDHVDAHRHYHLHPALAEDIVNIGRDFGMQVLRLPREPRDVLAGVEPCRGANPLMMPWTSILGRRIRSAGLSSTDRVFGLLWSGAMTKERLSGLIGRLPDGWNEIYLHPAVSDSFDGAAPGYRYREELDALLSPECADLVAELAAAEQKAPDGGELHPAQ